MPIKRQHRLFEGINFAWDSIDPRKFITVALVVVFSLVFQIKLGEFFGFYPNLALAALITVAFILNLFELIFWALLIVLVLNWQPAVTPEMIMIVTVPLAAFYFHKLLPWRSWFNNLFLIFLGALIFYFVRDPSLSFLKNPGIITKDMFAGLVFGAAAFFILRKGKHDF